VRYHPSNNLSAHLPPKLFPHTIRALDHARINSIIPEAEPPPEHEPQPEPESQPVQEEQRPLSWQEEKIEGFLAEHTLEDPVHVYRSLLRALTYIPDSWARSVLHKRIRPEFENFKYNRETIGGVQRYHRRLKKGLREARCIQRAGNGSREDLEKLLLVAYGRFGKRRRELVDDLLKPDDSEPPMTVSLPKSLAENKLFETLKELPALKHLSTQKISNFIKSQKAKAPPETTHSRAKIKGVFPAIPKENIWGRTVPKSRQIKIVKKWWAEMLEKLSPPVPQSEWDRLRDLSRGAIRIPERIPRRAYRKPEAEVEQKHEMVLEQLKSPRTGGNVAFDSKQGLYIKEKEEDEDAVISPQNYQRTMRRLYNSIWNQTPVMWKDEETKEWIVKWGELKTEFHSGKIPQASEKDPFFNDLAESQARTAHRKVHKKWRERKIQNQQESEDKESSEWEKVDDKEVNKVYKENIRELRRLRRQARQKEREESKGEQKFPP
jgi:hypothetical protein